MPLLNVAVPPLAVALQHFALSCHALLASTMPSLCYSWLRKAIATQYESSQYPCNTTHFHSSPSPSKSLLFLCLAPLSCALPLQFASWHCASLPSHYISMLFAATALIGFTTLRHCQTILNFASPQLCFISPRHASALLNEAPPYRCKSTQFRALPLHVIAPPCSAMAFLCSATPGLAIAMQR